MGVTIRSGKSVRWVASQLGHASPELTLRVYAHAMREEEADLSFLDFGGTKRHPRGTKGVWARTANRASLATPRRVKGNMARREGFASGLRPRCASDAKRRREPPFPSLRSYDLLPDRSQIALRFEESRKGKK